MNLEGALLVLRVLTALALLSFLGAVFLVLWRDYQLAAGVPAQQFRGRLVVIAVEAAHGEPEQAAPLEPDSPTLRRGAVTSHSPAVPPVGTQYPLLPLTTLGRAPTNAIVLGDIFCSQEHALIARRGGQWWLEDRRSSNGTRLNGEPVSEPVVLSSGDTIGIGRLTFRVELE